MKRYHLRQVTAALDTHWGLRLRRGRVTDDKHDGRWDAAYSRTGFVVSGNIPGRGYGFWRFSSLARIVRAFELDEVISTMAADQ